MCSYRFSESEMQTLVYLYKEHSCLWNSDSPEYRDQKLRKEAIQSILNVLNRPNFTELECRNKIKNMRSHYCQELKKIKKSARSSTRPIYKPTLSWFKALDEFLRPMVVQKTDSEMVCFESNDCLYEEDDLESLLQQADPLCNPSSSLPRDGAKRKKSDHDDTDKPSTSHHLTNPQEAFRQFLHDSPRPSVRTEFDIFAEGIAAQLKNMPLEEALNTQVEIMEVVTKRRLRLLRQSKEAAKIVENSRASVESCECKYRPTSPIYYPYISPTHTRVPSPTYERSSPSPKYYEPPSTDA